MSAAASSPSPSEEPASPRPEMKDYPKPGQFTEPSQMILDALHMPAYRETWEIYIGIQKSLERPPKILDQRCLDYFSPAAIDNALQLYWPILHPNWPVAHVPTFTTEDTPTALLAIMVAAGASILDSDTANYWLCVLEPWIFDELARSTSREDPYSKIKAIQHASLVCCHLIWEGGPKDRTRSIRKRYPQVVVAAREP